MVVLAVHSHKAAMSQGLLWIIRAMQCALQDDAAAFCSTCHKSRKHSTFITQKPNKRLMMHVDVEVMVTLVCIAVGSLPSCVQLLLCCGSNHGKINICVLLPEATFVPLSYWKGWA